MLSIVAQLPCNGSVHMLIDFDGMTAFRLQVMTKTRKHVLNNDIVALIRWSRPVLQFMRPAVRTCTHGNLPFKEKTI
ncbi:hypothetical protein Y032_0345g3112 [Ancylostoma ceylanicum]|uniref:Uncharacterized protein n=1 Tax=Ancylostoma ceylanicum TaxID=53326 RepID=A0A016RYE0_9BILA|nr:hypothetical protein Y032_0345g3112 [Ancylostoma ceylanicum]